MYSLYIDKSRKISDISKAPYNEEWLRERRIIGNKIYNYSAGVYLCREKEPLIELAEGAKKSWMESLEKEINELNKMNITNEKFNIIWNIN